MEEAERLCDRIVIIDHGRVVANDTVHGLHRLLPNVRSVELQFEGSAVGAAAAEDPLLTALASLPGISGVSRSEAGVRLETDDFAAGLARALDCVARAGVRVVSVHSARASLEDIFITLTGHALRDGPVAAPAAAEVAP
jgi:ABC-2 type transport system ATP-binding protein